MTEVSITSDGLDLALSAPYDPAMPGQAKRIGGRWDPVAKVWRFDVRDEPRVRALAVTVYGTDGSDADEPPMTVQVPVPPGCRQDRELRAAGRMLACRDGRDTPVRLAPNVVLVSGGWPGSGGSVKNPRLEEAQQGTVLEVRDVPASVASRMLSELGGVSRQDVLRAARERLLAQLAEVEAELTRCSP